MTKSPANILSPRAPWLEVLRLTTWGGMGFWLANFAVSLTQLAADYRRALSIAYVPMLFEALLGGLIVGWAVSYVVLRFHEVLPGRNFVQQSVALSFGALIAATVLVELISRSATSTDHPLRYFLIGLLFNTARFLTLGLVIGYLHEKRDIRAGR